jgi:hypothetical protein
MHPQTSARALLSAYAEMAGRSFNPPDGIELSFDTGPPVELFLDEQADHLRMSVRLGPVPAQGAEAFYRLLLNGNLFGLETAGAVLGIDGENDEAVLNGHFDLQDGNAHARDFAQALSQMTSTAARWRDRLAQAGLQDEAAGDPADDPHVRISWVISEPSCAEHL